MFDSCTCLEHVSWSFLIDIPIGKRVRNSLLGTPCSSRIYIDKNSCFDWIKPIIFRLSQMKLWKYFPKLASCFGIIVVTDCTVNVILRDPGAASPDRREIFSGEVIVLGKSLHQERESPSSVLDVNVSPKNNASSRLAALNCLSDNGLTFALM